MSDRTRRVMSKVFRGPTGRGELRHLLAWLFAASAMFTASLLVEPRVAIALLLTFAALYVVGWVADATNRSVLRQAEAQLRNDVKSVDKALRAELGRVDESLRGVVAESVEGVRGDLRGELGRVDESLRGVVAESVEGVRGGLSDPKTVWVFGVGRSGTTLVQNVLNSIPGFLIRGENGGSLNHFVEGMQEIHKHKGTPRADESPTNPWFGFSDIDQAGLARALKSSVFVHLLRPPSEATVVGAKEIRWRPGQLGELLHGYAQLFPGAKFVLVWRESEEIARSGWWAAHPNPLPEITRALAEIVALAEERDDVFLLNYSRDLLDSSGASLAPLFSFLSEPCNAESVSRALATRTGG